MLIVLIIPAGLVFMYGRMSGNRRQGYAIYATMMVMFLGAALSRSDWVRAWAAQALRMMHL